MITSAIHRLRVWERWSCNDHLGRGGAAVITLAIHKLIVWERWSCSDHLGYT